MHDTSVFTTSIGCRIWSSEGWLKVSHTGHGSINRLTSFKASVKSSDLIHFIEETPIRLINISFIRNLHKATNYCQKPSSWKLVPLCHKTCLKEINPGRTIWDLSYGTETFLFLYGLAVLWRNEKEHFPKDKLWPSEWLWRGLKKLFLLFCVASLF